MSLLSKLFGWMFKLDDTIEYDPEYIDALESGTSTAVKELKEDKDDNSGYEP